MGFPVKIFPSSNSMTNITIENGHRNRWFTHYTILNMVDLSSWLETVNYDPQPVPSPSRLGTHKHRLRSEMGRVDWFKHKRVWHSTFVMFHIVNHPIKRPHLKQYIIYIIYIYIYISIYGQYKELGNEETMKSVLPSSWLQFFSASPVRLPGILFPNSAYIYIYTYMYI